MRASCLLQRRKHLFPLARSLLFLGAVTTAALLLLISTSSVDRSTDLPVRSNADLRLVDLELSADPRLGKPGERPRRVEVNDAQGEVAKREENTMESVERSRGGASCATVEEMGETFAAGSQKESLKIRDLIHRHFSLHARVRGLPPDQFCQRGFVLGKASEAGFGNEMYKILSAAALSVMLNRSLIIGQTRGFYPFGDFISYTNHSFTLKEVKHLWRKHDCAGKYGRKLLIRIDNFERPTETNVLCSDWRIWKQPIIWLQGTTDAVAIQFFLKNINPGMKNAASILFGDTKLVKSRPNVFGELLRFIVTPSQAILEAINWVLKGKDPDIALHMRMLTNRSARAVKAALMCVKRAMHNHYHNISNPRVVLVSDTPSFIKEITPNLTEFADILHFDYNLFESSISGWRMDEKEQSTDFRARDWGPAPRWVAFVDFFLASRAKHAVVSGAHRRVGTTYAQLIAALAAANRHREDQMDSSFAFYSSFQSNLLVDGLSKQIGWGHAWNRFAGPLSCCRQPHQCAITPLLPPAWWDGDWQSPIQRDVRRLEAYGVRLTQNGRVIDGSLETYCKKREDHVETIRVFGSCSGTKCK
ncbi:uncharacterized protein LOC110025660 isoform X2 [Phalaenopsis equestris]|uniref:uncharacterized protein LOC110025660 isoform X2 n=1 Tax=Phalaenopsis equestris TaxID=78828 RepID=UPI0009E23A7F|nr:uncharacterized protein LOC110025660 isoform X2 [Phalaenopsis equestris]